MNEILQTRTFALERGRVNETNRTVEISFSSETPVESIFGTEILDHSPGAVRLDRLHRGGPLLLDHDPEDQVGVVEKAWISSDRKGRAVVRFSKGKRGEEAFGDVQDGIKRNISVGYQIHKTTEEGKIVRATDWEPLEISLVAIPADTSVGIGRSRGNGKDRKMENDNMEQGNEFDKARAKGFTKGKAAESERVAEIVGIGKMMTGRVRDDLVQQAITEDWPVARFRNTVLEELGNVASPIDTRHMGSIGMSSKEAGKFSILRAIQAMMSNDWRNAGFEREASRAVAQKLDRIPRGFFVPQEVLQHARRDLTTAAGSGSYAGLTVADNLLDTDFIEMLRNLSVVRSMGATVLSGLVGNVSIPGAATGTTAYWVAEGNDLTESTGTFRQLALSPSSVGCWTDITRKLLIQGTPAAEQLLRMDMAAALATEIDRVAINGSGSGAEPLGILNTTGIGAVAIGTNGGAPTHSAIVDLESEVAIDNADVGRLFYLTNTKVRGKLKKTLITPTYGDRMVFEGNTMNGSPAMITNNVPATLTKGTSTDCSAIIFGNFRDLIIAEWSGLDITIDTASLSTSGGVRVVGFIDCDIAVRHPESFAAIKDARA